MSVILPTFNRAHSLAGAVDSALAQGHADLEVIVVDDGSTDGTAELVADRYGRDPRVRYHHQPNGGVSAARNAGLGLATAPYVAFLDSDDEWQPWLLHLQLTALARFPEAGFVWSDIEAVDGSGNVVAGLHLAQLLTAYRYFPRDQLFSRSEAIADLGAAVPAEHLGRRVYVGELFSPMIMGNLVMPSSVVMRREILDRVGGFDTSLTTGEDYAFFLRACAVGPAAFSDVPGIRYRVGTADRLSGPAMGLPIARSYLTVLERTLVQEHDRVALPQSLVREARTSAHRWVGETALRSGFRSEARRHLATAFRLGGRRAWVLALLGLTFVPTRIVDGLVALRDRLVRRQRRRSPAGSA